MPTTTSRLSLIIMLHIFLHDLLPVIYFSLFHRLLLAIECHTPRSHRLSGRGHHFVGQKVSLLKSHKTYTAFVVFILKSVEPLFRIVRHIINL